MRVRGAWRMGVIGSWLGLVAVSPAAEELQPATAEDTAAVTNVALQAAPAPPAISLVGTFNDWNPADPRFQMESAGRMSYRLKRFFRAGKYEFKFMVDGTWERTYGADAQGGLAQPGKDLELKIPRAGAHIIELDLERQRWELIESELEEPQAVLDVPGPVEANIPITLDGSSSLARPNREILSYEFGQPPTDPVAAALAHAAPDAPRAVVTLPREATYQFWLKVDDGLESATNSATLKVQRSYQLVGDWTASEPADPATWMQRVRPGEFEKVLRPAGAGERQLILVRNHDPGVIVTHLSHYKFVLNGATWLPDPRADRRLALEDDHGGRNSGRYIGERGEDYGFQPLGEISFKPLRHEPDKLRYLNVADGFVQVTLRALAGDATRVSLYRAGTTNAIPLRRVQTRFGFDFWQATWLAPAETNPVSYYFTLTDGPATAYFGSAADDHAPGGVAPFTATLEERVPTPAWAKHVVWYQVFPDRFANGSADNDPPRTLPWTWDWYKCAEWERPNAAGTFSVDWYSRWFGGDFQGLLQRLPYFRQLGVTALYFCPVFAARSNHGYDTADYRHVAQWFGYKDPAASGDAADNGPATNAVGRVPPRGETPDTNTWQWTESDQLFREFIRQAHAQGLKVVIDGVFNHMGQGSFALQDVLTNGAQSLYADWFDITDWGPPVQYNSWDQSGGMPNFRKDAQHGIASASARQYLYDITRRWMDPDGDGDPADGVDGWRLDVAPDMPGAFWIAWRQHVKSINPRAFIIGEHWGVATKWLQGDQWDAVKHYRRLIAIRNSFPVLRTGLYQPWFTDDEKDLFGFLRVRGSDTIAVVINNSETDRSVELKAPFPEGSRVVDVVVATPVQMVEVALAKLGFPDFPQPPPPAPSRSVPARRRPTRSGPAHSASTCPPRARRSW